ncbi:hypothetical protein ACTWOG_000973 [Serratia marcescens]
MLRWIKIQIDKLPSMLVLTLVAIFILWVNYDSDKAKEAKALKRTAAEHRALVDEISTASAQKLEARLKELHVNEVHTERVIHTEIIKPVFSTVCATDVYVGMLNNSIDRAERALSGQPDRALRDHPAAPGR